MTGPIDPNTINPDPTRLPSGMRPAYPSNNTINDNLTYNASADPLLLGRYKLIRELGRGGMGVVWLAEDTVLTEDPNRPELRAIKILPEELATDPRAIAGLKHEARLNARLNHPGIVRLYNFEEDPAARVSFLLMEYISGLEDKHGRPVTYTLRGQVRPVLNLNHYLACKDRLDESETRRIGAQVCEALAYAHAYRDSDVTGGIIHRDIKPANILLDPNGRARLSDFGISSILHSAMTHLTGRAGSGTLPYMAPELFRGGRFDHRVDIYAMGIMLYEMLTGTPPFLIGDLASMHAEVPVPAIDGVSDAMNRIIARATAKSPDDRFDGADALRRELSLESGAGPGSNVESAAIHPVALIKRLTDDSDDYIEELGDGMKLEMVWIPGGEFIMGSPPDEDGRSSDEGPQTSVDVEMFWMSKFPVRRGQYAQVMGKAGWMDADSIMRPVSWGEAMDFCRKLSLHTDRNYTLPTEAQWEYACRARTTTPYYYGKSAITKGTIPPNQFGLCAMGMLVNEWCLSLYKPYPYSESDGRNDVSARGSRVVRGPNVSSRLPGRSALRTENFPNTSMGNYGFRVVCF